MQCVCNEVNSRRNLQQLGEVRGGKIRMIITQTNDRVLLVWLAFFFSFVRLRVISELVARRLFLQTRANKIYSWWVLFFLLEI